MIFNFSCHLSHFLIYFDFNFVSVTCITIFKEYDDQSIWEGIGKIQVWLPQKIPTTLTSKRKPVETDIYHQDTRREWETPINLVNE